jgi:hypothetical protein
MLAEWISLGRTKGLRAILAPQDLDALYAKYGEHEINAILAVMGNIAILRMLSPKTREWAAKFFGEYEAWETDYNDPQLRMGEDSDPVEKTFGRSRRIVKREVILPSEFRELPQTSRSNGLHGFFAVPGIGAWRAAVPSAWVDQHLSPRDPEAAAFVPRPEFAAEPARWTDADEQRYTRTSDKEADASHARKWRRSTPKADDRKKDRLPDW